MEWWHDMVTDDFRENGWRTEEEGRGGAEKENRKGSAKDEEEEEETRRNKTRWRKIEKNWFNRIGGQCSFDM